MKKTIDTIDLDSISVEQNYKITAELRRLIILYEQLFYDPPHAIAINPKDYLTIGVTIQKETFSISHSILIDGVLIFCKLNGPPEIIAKPEHAGQLCWLKKQDDKRLWPLLLGA